jgi:hypothetical protein
MGKRNFYGKMLADIRKDQRLDFLRIDAGEAAFRVWFSAWCLAAACSAKGLLRDVNGPIDTRRFAAMEHFDFELVNSSFAAMIKNDLASYENGIYTIKNWDWEPEEEKLRAGNRARQAKFKRNKKAKEAAAKAEAAAAAAIGALESSATTSDDLNTDITEAQLKAEKKAGAPPVKKPAKRKVAPEANAQPATGTKANISSMPDNTVQVNLAGYTPKSIERIIETIAEETGEGQELTTQFLNHDRVYDDDDRNWMAYRDPAFSEAPQEQSQGKSQSKKDPVKSQKKLIQKQPQEPGEMAYIHLNSGDEMEWMAEVDPAELATAAAELSAKGTTLKPAQINPHMEEAPPKRKIGEQSEQAQASGANELTSAGDKIDASDWRQLRIDSVVRVPTMMPAGAPGLEQGASVFPRS